MAMLSKGDVFHKTTNLNDLGACANLNQNDYLTA